MKTKLALALALCFAQTLPSTAAETAKPAKAAPAIDLKPYALNYKKFVLQNGLTLIVHEDHNVPVVAVNMWYHVGSRNEKRGKTGFAHLFEHFFFNGSENYPHGFREAMDDLGASNRNGTTNTDRTNFFEDVPVSALERTLYLEADRMGFLANYISKEMLERERGVVQNEKRQGENQPYGRVRVEQPAKMYPYSHPYSWTTIGSMDDLNAASLDDIKEWYKTYYGPNNAVISLAGDITPERALELVKKYFDGIAPGPALPRTETWIPTLDRNIRDEMEDQVPQVRIYRAWHAPAWKDPQQQHLDLLADVLASGKSSRLVKRLVYDKGTATSVAAFARGGEIAGTFQIVATLKPGADQAEVERDIDAAVKELLEKGPTAEELARVRTIKLASLSREMERIGSRANQLAENQTYGGTPDAHMAQLDVMVKATPAEIKATANQWLRANHYTMTVKPFGKLAAAKSTLNRKLLPALGEAPDVKFPAIERTTLSNGVNVMLLERHSAPIVNVALAIDAGAASDSKEKAGLASLTMELLDKGTARHNTFQLSEALDSLGSRLRSGTTQDQSITRLQATTANLAPSLQLMAETALTPTFPADQFTLVKERRVQEIAQEKAQPSALVQRVMPVVLYGADSAYGRPQTGYEQTVAAITREDVVKWHANWFKPSSATIVVAGDTTLAQLKPMLEASFGKWKAGKAPAKPLVTAPATQGKRIFLIDKPDAPQSTIMAAHISQTQGQPEDLALEPVMTNFGGMATARLNRNLRLDKHWSYGTSSQIAATRGQRPFFVVAPVQTDKTKESMQEIAKEIKDIAGARPITGEEYTSIMRTVTSRLGGRFETIQALESAALTTLNLGLPDDHWSSYAARTRALSEQQLANAAAKFIKPDEVVWIVIGDLRKIEAGVRSLNWGEVSVLNADGVPVGR